MICFLQVRVLGIFSEFKYLSRIETKNLHYSSHFNTILTKSVQLILRNSVLYRLHETEFFVHNEPSFLKRWCDQYVLLEGYLSILSKSLDPILGKS